MSPFGGILLQNSVFRLLMAADRIWLTILFGRLPFGIGLYLFCFLVLGIYSCKTVFSRPRRRPIDIPRKLSQVLGGSGEQHFVANAA